MLAMAEEETKKEKDCNSDDDADPKFKYRNRTEYLPCVQSKVVYQHTHHHEKVIHQFITEHTTPPPDLTV